MKIILENGQHYLLTEEEYSTLLEDKTPAYYFHSSEEDRLDSWLFLKETLKHHESISGEIS